jgi:hypothetical protein
MVPLKGAFGPPPQSPDQFGPPPPAAPPPRLPPHPAPGGRAGRRAEPYGAGDGSGAANGLCQMPQRQGRGQKHSGHRHVRSSCGAASSLRSPARPPLWRAAAPPAASPPAASASSGRVMLASQWALAPAPSCHVCSGTRPEPSSVGTKSRLAPRPHLIQRPLQLRLLALGLPKACQVAAALILRRKPRARRSMSKG